MWISLWFLGLLAGAQAGFPLLAEEDFEKGEARWRPTDDKAWRILEEGGNRVYALTQQSDYQPPVRSPFNISLLRDVWASDFVFEAKVKSTSREYGHRDLCFIFNWQDPTHFYYVHIASQADPHANSIFLVNGQPRVSIARRRTEGTRWTNGKYHTVRIVRETATGAIRVYFDDMTTPIMEAEDKTLLSGRFGVGSFDDTGRFDDIKIWGAKSEPLQARVLPDFYREVTGVQWVVRDLESVLNGWKKLGWPSVQAPRRVDIREARFRNRPVSFSILKADGRLGPVAIEWIQPQAGPDNAYTEFLSRHGDGIFSLMHRAPAQEIVRETGYLESLGIGVLQRESLAGPGPPQRVYFDTQQAGKYVLGLEDGPPARPESRSTAPAPFDGSITQFAFVAGSTFLPSLFWQKLGFPEISLTHGALRDRDYRGSPGAFDHKLGWQRHGSVVYEWCIPLQGPTAYEEHLKAHGEGFHHLAFAVEDIDAVIERWTALGYPALQSGAWGQADRPGSGRFAYMDTDSIGGVTIELLWSFRPASAAIRPEPTPR